MLRRRKRERESTRRAGAPSGERLRDDPVLALAFRLVAARQPTVDELQILTETWQTHLAKYQADKAAAEKLVTLGESKRNESLDIAELAAYTMTCNLILNLDEVVTKE